LRLVIFDVDGTLVDSQHHIVAAQRRAFAVFGLTPPTREQALSVVGLSLPEAFATLVGADGPVLELSEAYKDAWTELRGQPGFAEVLYPGARETIAALSRRADLRLGIATGKSRKGVDRVLAAQGWGDIFATIQTADEHPSKPDPSMILAAMAETGIAAEAAAMIGDTTFDMAMAVAAGVRPIGVAWGYHDPAALVACGAEVVVDDFAALRALLDGPSDPAAA
jgi:phosphoglycolate phosphatase